MLLFLVTPCFVVSVQRCMEWIPIKKEMDFSFQKFSILPWYYLFCCWCLFYFVADVFYLLFECNYMLLVSLKNVLLFGINSYNEYNKGTVSPTALCTVIIWLSIKILRKGKKGFFTSFSVDHICKIFKSSKALFSRSHLQNPQKFVQRPGSVDHICKIFKSQFKGKSCFEWHR